ncbi:MAG: hypothetical protein ACRDRH_17745 [Pseudonocardia sp.]
MTGETHRTLREQVGAYALGQLSGERWRTVHAHLEVCVICRADLDEIAPVAGLLGAARDRLGLDDLGEPEPDGPPLPAALLEEVRAASSVDGGRGGRLGWMRRRGRTSPDDVALVGSGTGSAAERNTLRRHRVPIVAAAVIGLLTAAGVGFAIGAAGGGVTVAYENVAVRTLDPAVHAQARLVAHTWGTEVKLVASGFQPGTAYRVTVTDDAGRVVSAGEFLGTGEVEMVCNLNSSILRADASSFQVAAPNGQVVLDAAV